MIRILYILYILYFHIFYIVVYIYTYNIQTFVCGGDRGLGWWGIGSGPPWKGSSVQEHPSQLMDLGRL